MHLQALILGKVHANALFFRYEKILIMKMKFIFIIQEVKKNANI